MPKGFLPSLQSARVVELLSVGAGAILLSIGSIQASENLL